jgi:hypothetical protein
MRYGFNSPPRVEGLNGQILALTFHQRHQVQYRSGDSQVDGNAFW